MSELFDRLTYHDVAKTIDHSLLRPELDDSFIDDGIRLALEYDVASVTCRPVDVAKAARMLRDSDVKAGTVVGFPHGDMLTATKVFEAQRALEQGAQEVDMVINIGALKSGRDAFVQADIGAVVEVAHAGRAIVKVIFENAYLTDDEKIRACHLAEAAGADFVKTSTGFAASGATHDDLRLMRANTSAHVQVKAAGGVRTLDALLAVMELGVTRIGATATRTILDDFRARKAGKGAAAATSGGIEQSGY
jgi:deoxyribose-phosphate aldolase